MNSIHFSKAKSNEPHNPTFCEEMMVLCLQKVSKAEPPVDLCIRLEAFCVLEEVIRCQKDEPSAS